MITARKRSLGQGNIYHSRMLVGNVFGHVCLSVCLSVCLCVCLCVCVSVCSGYNF